MYKQACRHLGVYEEPYCLVETSSGVCKWIHVANMNYSTTHEGLLQGIACEVVGGNNYEQPPCVAQISFINHLNNGIKSYAKIIGKTTSDYSIGYVINGNIVNIYLKTNAYPNPVWVRLLGKNQSPNNDIIRTQNEVTTEPSGIQYISITTE